MSQPFVLTARCAPPRHQCALAHRQGLHRCLPVLVVHVHPAHVDIKLFVSKPWELTRESYLALLRTFEAWAWVDHMSGAKCTVNRSAAEWSRLPLACVEQFTSDIAAHLFFQRSPAVNGDHP